MKVRYSPYFYKQYKKLNVRIRSSIDQRIELFIKNPNDFELNNHLLQALYQELTIGEDIIAYFVELGTHDQLYRKSKAD